MRIAICEDDENMQARLGEAIDDWAKARNIVVDILCYPSAEAFLMVWPDVQFDLAFFDIEMGTISGIELAELVRKTDKDMLIVFVTSHKQYALKSYDVNAFHYLIKPLSAAKLLPILDKAQIIISCGQSDYIIIHTESGQIKLLHSEIFYISISDHTATIYTVDKHFQLRKTISDFSEILPSHFLRCHRSHIVNLYKINCLYKDTLLLSNDVTLPISRKNSKIIGEAFMRLHIGRAL